MPLTRAVLSLAEAQRILEHALRAAGESGLSVAVAVTDAAGVPLVCARMDGVARLVLDAACGKAYTAAALGVRTSTWEEQARTSPWLPAMVGTVPGFTPMAGGVPVLHQGEVAGAVGVSGADSATDDRLAVEAARALAA